MSLAAALDNLCGLIERTLLADQAQEVLDTCDTHMVVVLPMWAWTRPNASLGRKQQRCDEFPVRLHWDGPLVRPMPHATTSLTWCIDGLGVSDEGTQRVDLPPGCHDTTVPYRSRQLEVADTSRLEELVADGNAARWEFLQLLEQVTAAALERCHALLVREYSMQAYGDPNKHTQPILHKETLEALRIRLVYGDNDHGDSPMMGLIRASHRQDFAKVEPQRWLRAAAWKRVRDAVHDEAGDPQDGALIRRTARTLGSDDPTKIAAALQGVGPKRIAAALALAPHPDAAPLHLMFYPDDSQDVWLNGQLTQSRRFL